MPPTALTNGEIAAVVIGLAIAADTLTSKLDRHCGYRYRTVGQWCGECKATLGRIDDLDHLAIKFSDMLAGAGLGQLQPR